MMEILKNFVVIEGLDGAGTSTQTKLLSEKIKNSFFTFEPTDDKIGLMIRECLQKKIIFASKTIAHLFSADRSEHLYKKDGVVERCGNNQIVLCDRYLFSSLAYQSVDLPFEYVLNLNKNFPLPELLFFIDTPVEVCQERIKTRGDEVELYENKQIQEKILSNYIKAFSYYEKKGLKIIKLDGTLSINELLEKELIELKNITGK